MARVGSVARVDSPVVVMCHLRWDFVYQRPQHLMSLCARDRRVVFLEEPMLGSGDARLELRESIEGVTVATPHLPADMDAGAVLDAQRALLDELLANELDGAPPVLWYYTPMAVPFSRHVRARAVVYDCMDELSMFLDAPRDLATCEAGLLKSADVVFTGGHSLYAYKKSTSAHPNIHAFPSSVDVAHFAKAREAIDEPSDQAQISGPRVGFFGVIDERFDIALLTELAALRPELSFVMLGPIAKIDPDMLPRRANIHWLGPKRYDELPSYLGGWDVAILPFARNDSTRFISPTKTPEYLAAGSAALDERAHRMIPGGHHLSGRPLIDPLRSPMYFERAKGCRVWDVDGHEYIDYLLAFGAILLGYAHDEVDDAAIAQLRRGSLLPLNHPMHVRFIERLLPRFEGAEMGLFFKTGSEATTAALRIARRATGRRKIARCGYHGWHDWCLPEEDFVPGGLGAQIPEFNGRDPASLEALLATHRGEIAAVILAPEMIYPTDRATLLRLMDLTHRAGALFVLDEVKTAFRTPPGSMQRHLEVRPDLTTMSKALGNGWPIAAVVGPRDLMRCAAGMHLSATYHGDAACMAAALATLDVIEREDVCAHLWRLGQRLIDGLEEGARRHHIAAHAYGEPVPSMPFLRFTDADGDRNDRVRTAFYCDVLARGILLHPRHLWFISHAHSEADIDHTIAACDAAFAHAAAICG